MNSKLPTFLEMFSQLIEVSSISSLSYKNDISNRPIIDLLSGWFESIGFQVEVQKVPHTNNKFNMLAKSGIGSGGLLLTGHTDTVPFDEGRWHRNPFKLEKVDNKLYGLGSADMKGFFAFILDSLRDIKLDQLKKPIYILATADEEISMAGARFFSKTTTIRPEFCIIGEPTSLKPIRAHKGYIANTIRVIGKSGHSSDPEKGVNAIEIMNLVIDKILHLRNFLKEKYNNDHFLISYPTLNLGSINGGDSCNRICACCEMNMDIRPLPSMALKDLHNLMEESLNDIKRKWPNSIQIIPLIEDIPGYESPGDSTVIKFIEKSLGHKAEAVNYCTEAPFLQEICPTIVLGPGSIEQAHQPDEYIETKFIEPTRDILKSTIHSFCLSSHIN